MPIRLSPAAARAALAYAFAVTMLGTTLPAPLYALYSERFGFSALLDTVIFAVYAVGVIAALLLLGRLSDDIGRLPALAIGLVLSALSAIALLITQGLVLVLVARVLSGLSAGIFTGTATAAIIDLSDEDSRGRATLLATVANIGGLGLGPLVAGAFAEFVTDPLRLVFVADLGLLAIAAVALWLVPETVEDPPGLRVRFQALAVPPKIRATFVRASLAGFAAFAVTGLFTSVAPSILSTLLGVESRFGVGVVVFSLFAASAVAQTLEPPKARTALYVACALLAVGVGLLAGGIIAGSLALFVVGAIVAGAGQGAGFRGSLASLTGETEAKDRAEVTSAFFVVLYVAISLPVVGVGLLSDATSLKTSALVFSGVIIAIVLTVVALLRRRQRR